MKADISLIRCLLWSLCIYKKMIPLSTSLNSVYCAIISVVCVTLQCLQNQSSDVRLVSERVLWWVFKEPSLPSVDVNLIKPLLKTLLDNTKDKNTSVRAQSEHTIVNLLRLRQGEETMQVWLSTPYCNLHTDVICRAKHFYTLLSLHFRLLLPFWTLQAMTYCQSVTAGLWKKSPASQTPMKRSMTQS